MTRRIPISEIFYSIQGEGARIGLPHVFVRTANCVASGLCEIACDTEYSEKSSMTLQEIKDEVSRIAPSGTPILLTGGEPMSHWDAEFKEKFNGTFVAIETSGILPLRAECSYITVSPKVSDGVLIRNFQFANELRYVVRDSQILPIPPIKSDSVYISPEFVRDVAQTKRNIKYCVDLVKKNMGYRLSVQVHKLIEIP
jgi:7-carboxy-7-deazaguanine synthase